MLVLITELARTEHNREPLMKASSVYELSGVYQWDSHKMTVKCVRLELQVLTCLWLGVCLDVSHHPSAIGATSAANISNEI